MNLIYIEYSGKCTIHEEKFSVINSLNEKCFECLENRSVLTAHAPLDIGLIGKSETSHAMSRFEADSIGPSAPGRKIVKWVEQESSSIGAFLLAATVAAGCLGVN